MPLPATEHDTTKTLSVGQRNTAVTVTTTPQSLDTLLNGAVTGRKSLSGRKYLRLNNSHGTNSFFITNNPALMSPTSSNATEVKAGGYRDYLASESFTDNTAVDTASRDGSGFYLLAGTGTITVLVEEAK